VQAQAKIKLNKKQGIPLISGQSVRPFALTPKI
jgi:hypothetical protein